MNFSVLLSVYKNDDAAAFQTALASISTLQTVKPSEIVLVVDGPVPEAVDKVIAGVTSESPDLYKIVRFEQNQGLGIALQKGLEVVTNDIVMRMDSDDVAESIRFEKQLSFMETHPDVALCGGQIEEFMDDESHVVGKRTVPCTNEGIYQYAKLRCPFNHMTVAFRRSKVLEAGNYQPWYWNEDYYLWIRMMIGGYQFANLPDTLVHVRVGKDMYARRGGMRYFKSEAQLQQYMWRNGIISFPRYCFNVLVRVCVQVLIPNCMRGLFFKYFFRKH